MKKLTAVLLSVILLLSLAATSFSAQETPAEPLPDGAPAEQDVSVQPSADDKESLCEDAFIRYLLNRFGEYGFTEEMLRDHMRYEERFCHRDDNGEVDWALVRAEAPAAGSYPWNVYWRIGNRIITTADVGGEPFTFGLGLYDAAEDTFYDLYKVDDLERYDGLADAVETYGTGRLLGDMDQDNLITIIDVTILQRCLAKMRDFPEDDLIMRYDSFYTIEPYDQPWIYYSDFNRDKQRDITDASCIQRWLVHMAYPTFD